MLGFMRQHRRVNPGKLFPTLLSGVLELAGLWHVHQQQHTPTHTSVPTSDRVRIHAVAKARFSVTIHMNKHIHRAEPKRSELLQVGFARHITYWYSVYVVCRNFFRECLSVYSMSNILSSAPGFVLLCVRKRVKRQRDLDLT